MGLQELRWPRTPLPPAIDRQHRRLRPRRNPPPPDDVLLRQPSGPPEGPTPQLAPARSRPRRLQRGPVRRAAGEAHGKLPAYDREDATRGWNAFRVRLNVMRVC